MATQPRGPRETQRKPHTDPEGPGIDPPPGIGCPRPPPLPEILPSQVASNLSQGSQKAPALPLTQPPELSPTRNPSSSTCLDVDGPAHPPQAPGAHNKQATSQHSLPWLILPPHRGFRGRWGGGLCTPLPNKLLWAGQSFPGLWQPRPKALDGSLHQRPCSGPLPGLLPPHSHSPTAGTGAKTCSYHFLSHLPHQHPVPPTLVSSAGREPARLHPAHPSSSPPDHGAHLHPWHSQPTYPASQ